MLLASDKENKSTSVGNQGHYSLEDAKAAVESVADGMVVTSHRGRSMDCWEGAIDEVCGITKHLKTKKGTRNIEILFDGDIREGTDTKSLALGAHGNLVSQPYLLGDLSRQKERAESVTKIPTKEPRRPTLSGMRDQASANSNTIVEA